MPGTNLKEMELGYLYYSLYSYRRKIEAEIKKLIREDSQPGSTLHKGAEDKQADLLVKLTSKLRNISLITSRIISLNKVYR